MTTQQIRLLDVFAIGPAMIWGARNAYSRSPLFAALLALSGVLTIAVNGDNYLRGTPDEAIRGRVVDLAIGPLMVWGAIHSRRVNLPVATFLGLAGVSAIATNTDNLFRFELRAM